MARERQQVQAGDRRAHVGHLGERVRAKEVGGIAADVQHGERRHVVAQILARRLQREVTGGVSDDGMM